MNSNEIHNMARAAKFANGANKEITVLIEKHVEKVHTSLVFGTFTDQTIRGMLNQYTTEVMEVLKAQIVSAFLEDE